MPLFQRVLLAVSLFVVIPALLAGLIRRRLYRVCYSFPIYLASVWTGDLLVWFDPTRFHTWSFFLAKETAYAFLKFSVAIELASLTFQAFPGAKVAARRVIVTMMVLILGALLFRPVADLAARTVALAIQPRLANGTALLFAAVWMLILWYNLPVHPFHRAILRGFVPYLLVFTVVLGLTHAFQANPPARLLISYADGLAYVGVLLYWTWAAWRPPEESTNPELLRKLQPWRDRLPG